MAVANLAIFFLLFLSLNHHHHQPVFSLRPLTDLCKLNSQTQLNLRSDQITVLINGYSESRIHLLQSIAVTYSSIPSVALILVLWGNTTTPLRTLTHLSHNLTASSFGAPISILRQPTESLNSRFIPRSIIKTRAVAICDDDVEIDRESFEFAFNIWKSNQYKLVGFFARCHDLDLSNKTWMYTMHADKYSILLTKLMVLNTMYLYKYSCGGDSKMGEMRNVVDEMRNCEDILMNFVVTNETGSGPVLVDAKKLRDYGDARNDGVVLEREVKEVGLSSRGREHRKRRGECIREFHRVMGRMPLRYSYGKVVNSVGEQGLCQKGGKLVACDRQIL